MSVAVFFFTVGIFCFIMLGSSTSTTTRSIFFKKANIYNHTEYVRSNSTKPRNIVFEFGSNNGDWIKEYMAEHRSETWIPIIVEPQPQFAQILSEFTQEYGGRFYQNAVWNESGINFTFYTHTNKQGIGSSLFDKHVYQKDSKVDERVEYQVTTVDVADVIRDNSLYSDNVILRFDIEGAEYVVIRRLLLAGMACWSQKIYFEAHALYTKRNRNFQAMDAVLPWLFAPCSELTVESYYNLKAGNDLDPLVTKEWADDVCQKCDILTDGIDLHL